MTLDQRREMFLGLISAYSEDIYAAGWSGGIEAEIRQHGDIWTVMAWSCKGWPLGYRGDHGWDPLNADEMLFILSLIEAESPSLLASKNEREEAQCD